jgi:hypothetical protein
MANKNNKYHYKVKYNIPYFGHKWGGFIRVDYKISYIVRLIDEASGKVVAEERDDLDNTQLIKIIEDSSDRIVNFVDENIAK